MSFSWVGRTIGLLNDLVFPRSGQASSSPPPDRGGAQAAVLDYIANFLGMLRTRSFCETSRLNFIMSILLVISIK
jgi:hypothetical protein